MELLVACQNKIVEHGYKLKQMSYFFINWTNLKYVIFVMHFYASFFFSECTPGISYNSTFRYGIKQRRWHLTGKYNVLILWSKRDNSNKNSDQKTFITTMLWGCRQTKYLLFFFIWHNTGFCYYKASNIDFIHKFVLGIFFPQFMGANGF